MSVTYVPAMTNGADKTLIIPDRITLSAVAWDRVRVSLEQLHETKSVVLYRQDGVHLRADVQRVPNVPDGLPANTIALYASPESAPLLVGRRGISPEGAFPPVLSGDRVRTASEEFWSRAESIAVFQEFYQNRPLEGLYTTRNPLTEYSREEIRKYLMREAPLRER